MAELVKEALADAKTDTTRKMLAKNAAGDTNVTRLTH